MRIKGAMTILEKRAKFYGWAVPRLVSEIDRGFDENVKVLQAYEVYKMDCGYRWSGENGETWVLK